MCIWQHSGAIASAVTGFILDRTGHFFWAFAVAATITVFGVFFWNLMVSPVEPIIWGSRAAVDLRRAAVELA